MKKVLLIDENQQFCEEFCDFLKNNNINAVAECNALKAIKSLTINDYDLIILNDSITQLSAEQLILLTKELNSDIIITVMSEQSNEDDELKFLRLGVDEFLSKHLSSFIILERINKLFRINKDNISAKKELYSKQEDLIVNFETRVVIKNQEVVNLSFIEFDILVYFLKNKNRVITREEFLKNVWNVSIEKLINDPRTVDTHIKNIRKKTRIRSIQTIRNSGYQWLESSSSQE